MENNKLHGVCTVGIVFALLEIFIVIGENLGWVSYNMDLESFLFIIFLIIIINYQENNQNKKMEVKKIE